MEGKIQFTVQAKVTYINELHLNWFAVHQLREFATPPRKHDVMDKDLVNQSEILIFRASKEFKIAFPHKNYQTTVLKTKW